MPQWLFSDEVSASFLIATTIAIFAARNVVREGNVSVVSFFIG